MADTAPSPSPYLAQALAYLERGWPVFPVCRPIREGRCVQHGECGNAGKRPLVRWDAYQTRLPTTDEVTAWWTRDRTANIGMATGALSGIVVLDCDGPDARKAALDQGVPPTPAVFTGKPGGIHYHLSHPGFAVQNFARKGAAGLDFRGDGGYVLLPSSHHARGADYRWVDGTNGLALAVPPDWLLDLIHAPHAAADSDAEHTSLDLDLVLAGIPAGQRDDTLWRYACRLRSENVPLAFAELFVRQAARACQPPFNEDAAAEKVQRAYREYAPTLTLEIPAAFPSDAPPVEPPADREPWRVYGAATFLARELPVVEWRIEHFVRDQALVWTFGAPGTIKTYIATDAALAVASGGQFLGQFACQQGKVLIVQEDTLEGDYQQAYLRPLIEARGLDPATLEEWLFIAPQAGMRLDDGMRLQELTLWLTSQRPALVILDAFYLLHIGEGHGKEMKALVNTLRALRSQAGTAIWIIDHDRKSGEGRDKDNPIDRLIGGREKSGGCDAILEVEAVKGKSGQVFITTHKLRGGGKPLEPLEVRLEDGHLTSAVVVPNVTPGAAEAVYDWLRRQGGSRSKRQLMSGCDIAERTANYAINALKAKRLIRWNRGGTRGQEHLYYALSEPDPDSGSIFE